MEYILKGLASLAIILIPWVLRNLFVTVERRKKMSQKDFDFTKELFELGQLKIVHNFQLAVGFSGLTGQQTDARIVRLLLSQHDPYGLSKDYGKGRQFLVPVFQDGDCKKIQFDKKLQKIGWFLPREGFYLFCYVITAFIAVIPLIFVGGLPQLLGGSLIGWLALIGVLTFAFGFLSIVNLSQYASLMAAKRVDKAFKEQDKSTDA